MSGASCRAWAGYGSRSRIALTSGLSTEAHQFSGESSSKTVLGQVAKVIAERLTERSEHLSSTRRATVSRSARNELALNRGGPITVSARRASPSSRAKPHPRVCKPTGGHLGTGESGESGTLADRRRQSDAPRRTVGVLALLAYLRDVLCLLPKWPVHRVLELAPAYWATTLDQPDVRRLLEADPYRRLTLGHA